MSRQLFFFMIFLFQLTSCTVENETPEKNPKTIQKKDLNGTVRILFAGDLLLDRGVRQEIQRKGLDHLFSGVDSIIDSHDFFVVNMETPLTKIESPLNKKYIFRSEPELLPKLKAHKITHAILSNNHSMDQGKEGLLDTYKNFIKNEIETIGFGKNINEFCSPTLISTKGHTIALFGSVQIPIENWFQVDDQAGICQMQGKEFETYIENYHQEHPDHIIVVNLHWGLEYLSTPNFTQIQHAKNLIEAGTDIIIGHHPHVIQSIQKYKGKMVYYSIGNFIFDSSHPNSKKAFLISLEIDENGEIRSQKIPIKIANCRPALDS